MYKCKRSTWEDEMSFKIDELRGKRRELRDDTRGLSDGFDGVVFNNNCATLEHAILGIHGNDQSIVEYK